MERDRLTVREAADLLGASPSFIRRGLQQGRFPWGYAVKNRTRWSYYINKRRMEKCLRD